MTRKLVTLLCLLSAGSTLGSLKALELAGLTHITVDAKEVTPDMAQAIADQIYPLAREQYERAALKRGRQ